MKKQLLALSLLAAFAGMAHAQTNVTIYGVVDTGYIKETGSDLQMGEWNDSRIGFRGTEDLGSGYAATFQLEQRLDLWNGKGSDPEWDGASNVGIKGPFGSLRLGRMNEIETESFRRLDPFNQEGVGSMMKGTQRTSRISNVARYDSPSFGGFRASLGYYLGQNTQHVNDDVTKNKADNDGFAVGLNYDNGPCCCSPTTAACPIPTNPMSGALAAPTNSVPSRSVWATKEPTTRAGKWAVPATS